MYDVAMAHRAAIVGAALSLTLALPSTADAARPRPVPQKVAAKFNLADPWYANYREFRGIPVVGSVGVEDRTLTLARRTTARVLATVPRETIRRLRLANFRIVVVARDESMSDIPGASVRLGKEADTRYWGGFGATRDWPICVATEANLADRSGDENILVYSLAISIAELALEPEGPSFSRNLNAAYANAIRTGLWPNTYARAGLKSYWGEGVQSYFNSNREGPRAGDGIHGRINTRRELSAHDPKLYRLIEEVFGPGG